jgi:hypothetical protein
MIKTYNLATWNMQKGPAVQDLAKTNIFAAAALSARFQILEQLKNNHDVVFVQEPPKEIRAETQVNIQELGAQENVWISYNENWDNQDHKSANRPAYYSNLTIFPAEAPHDCPVSGNEDACRLVAMGWAEVVQLGKVMFMSLHATSGFGAKKNTDDILSWLDHWIPAEHPGVKVVLIGADFNHTPNPVSRVMDNCRVEFSLPNNMTQQSGNAIDGFCCLIFDNEITVKWDYTLRLCTGEHDSVIKTKMEQVYPFKDQAVNKRGYIGEVTSGPLIGTSKTLHGDSMWIRMYDHCAVIGKITINAPDS